MSHLTLEKIAANSKTLKLRAIPVPTPELDAEFAYVAELTAEQRDELETEWVEYRDTLGDGETPIGFRAFCVAYCLCDENRILLATDRDTRNAAALHLQAQSGRAVNRLFNKVTKFNGLTKSDEEELEKNLGNRQSAGGNGELPSASDTPPARRGSKKSAAANTPSSESSADSSQSGTNA